MAELINHLRKRLQLELPHKDIRNEGLSEHLLNLLLKEEEAIKEGFKKNPPRICAVMLAFYQKKEEWFLPMMVRPSKSRVHPGQVAFPGGKQEEEDQDLIHTAIRETEEEVGVNISREQILGSLSPVFIPPSNSMVTPIVSFLPQPPSYTPNPAEVASILDIRLTDLKNEANHGIKKVPMAMGGFLELPAFNVENHTIWGGTARMIGELLKIL